MPRIYLSHNLLFSESARILILPKFVNALEELGCEVYEPWHRNEQVEREKKPGWAHRVSTE